MIEIQQIGYVSSDAKVEEVNGKKVINFSIGTTERFKGKSGNIIELTTWLYCAYWSDSDVFNYIKKGSQVYVRGSLSASVVDSPSNGEKQVRLNCRVSKIHLLSSKKEVSDAN